MPRDSMSASSAKVNGLSERLAADHNIGHGARTCRGPPDPDQSLLRIAIQHVLRAVAQRGVVLMKSDQLAVSV